MMRPKTRLLTPAHGNREALHQCPTYSVDKKGDAWTTSRRHSGVRGPLDANIHHRRAAKLGLARSDPVNVSNGGEAT